MRSVNNGGMGNHADAVFDLDGVLSTGDTFTALLAERLRQAPWLIVPALPGIVAWAVSRHDVLRNARAARAIAATALRGVPEARYAALAERVAARLVRDPGWTRAEPVERMRALRASGRRVVVATASERRLAAAFLAGIGAEHDLLIASELRWTSRGGRFTAHRRGVGKRDALLAAGVDLGAATFFTDSFDDYATAALVDELVLVHPSAGALRRYAASDLAFTVLAGR